MRHDSSWGCPPAHAPCSLLPSSHQVGYQLCMWNVWQRSPNLLPYVLWGPNLVCGNLAHSACSPSPSFLLHAFLSLLELQLQCLRFARLASIAVKLYTPQNHSKSLETQKRRKKKKTWKNVMYIAYRQSAKGKTRARAAIAVSVERRSRERSSRGRRREEAGEISNCRITRSLARRDMWSSKNDYGAFCLRKQQAGECTT